MPKIKVTLSIGLVGCNQEDVLEMDDLEWGDCETDAQREELMDDYCVEDDYRLYKDGIENPSTNVLHIPDGVIS